MNDLLSRYSEELNKLLRNGSSAMTSIVNAAKLFSAEERLEIASNLHKVLEFNFSSYSVQELVRKRMPEIHPNADLSWIPDWRTQTVFD